MTVWNDAQYTQRLAHANWMSNVAVLMHLNERATGDPARDWLSSWAHRWFVGRDLRVLVLGCGEGWLERAIAQWPFVASIDAVDFAAAAVERAAAQAPPNIRYGVVDLNRDTLQRDAYDVVVAHSVLHHVQNLEHAFAEIENAMKPQATLIVNEYAGPNRFQFSDEVLAMMNALAAALRLPERKRPTVEEMIFNDPTEAVRAAELLPMIGSAFEVLERKDLGGTILQHLLYETSFRFEHPKERALVEMLCTIEAMLVDSGRIASDFVLLAARKRGARVTRANRPLPPRPEAARDVEPDPLGRVASATLHAPRVRLAPHHLRLLRVALLSQQPRRANLYRESALLALRERLLARGETPWEWLRHRAPSDAEVQGLLGVAQGYDEGPPAAGATGPGPR
ncbi:MAG TPA: class I SAM-dependent methyltransferase [Thermoanaerobaculia bacterium]